jgi:NADP-dependent 3-hydroxy acid dehydrogenase YdfG
MASIAVITGASAGISRNEDRLARLQREIESLGRRAMVLPLDVAHAEAVEAAADRVEEMLGPIDA